MSEKEKENSKSSQNFTCCHLTRTQPSIVCCFASLCCFRHPINNFQFRPLGVITNIYITRPITNKMRNIRRDHQPTLPRISHFSYFQPKMHLQLDGFYFISYFTEQYKRKEFIAFFTKGFNQKLKSFKYNLINHPLHLSFDEARSHQFFFDVRTSFSREDRKYVMNILSFF